MNAKQCGFTETVSSLSLCRVSPAHSSVVLLSHDIICFHDSASYCKCFSDFQEVEQVTACLAVCCNSNVSER